MIPLVPPIPPPIPISLPVPVPISLPVSMIPITRARRCERNLPTPSFLGPPDGFGHCGLLRREGLGAILLDFTLEAAARNPPVGRKRRLAFFQVDEFDLLSANAQKRQLTSLA